MPCWLATLLPLCITVFSHYKTNNACGWRFSSDSEHFFFLSCYATVNGVSLALNKWPWARCAPWMLGIIGSRRRLLAPCRVRRAASYPPQRGSKRLCKIWKKSGQGRLGGRQEGRNLWERSRKEMGELEHFPLVDTPHLCPERETERREKGKDWVHVFFMPVFVFVTHIYFPYSQCSSRVRYLSLAF